MDNLANINWNDPLLINAIGSAVGGFLGVVLFFSLRFAIELWRSRPKRIRDYFCVSSMNRGQNLEHKGELQHHSGKLVDGRDALRKVDAKHPIWEWSRDMAGDRNGNSVFYGPYCMELAEPGLYEVRFRIRGFGFSRPTEISEDRPLLSLDVLRTQVSTTLAPGGQEPAKYTLVNFPRQDTIAMKHVPVSVLAYSKWTNIKLRFFSDGKGEWEFRCFAFDGLGNQQDNLALSGSNVRIFFDRVTLLRVSELRVPWA